MEIIIGEPVETIKNKYVFELRAMHGDADSFTDVEYTAVDMEDAERLAGELPKSSEHREDRDWYYKIFLEDIENEDIRYNSIWPSDDPEYNYDMPARLWRWELYYYDSNGVKFHTNQKG